MEPGVSVTTVNKPPAHTFEARFKKGTIVSDRNSKPAARTVTEPQRQTPVSHEADVVVCGGGTAGLAAAVCAGRLGLRVVMVERSVAAGGMLNVCGGIQDIDNKGGFVAELVEGLKRRGQWDPAFSWCLKYNRFAIPDYADELLDAAGVRPLYLSMAAEPLVEDGRIAGVFVESKSGRTAVRAPVAIDASGDGDIAVRAGAAFEMGRDSDGGCQAMSAAPLFLEYDGAKIDKEAFGVLLQEASRRTGVTLPSDSDRLRPVPATAHTFSCGMPHLTGHDATDADSLSDALIALRRQSREIFEFFRANTDHFDNAVVGPPPLLPGVRESRRIVCDERVRLDDALTGRRRGDGLFTVRQNVDIHRVSPDESTIVLHKVKPYRMPYGALLPQGVENLLVIGRCIGGEHESHASYRVMGDCLAMGEAAALAAGESLKRGCSPREAPANVIADAMRKRGYEL